VLRRLRRRNIAEVDDVDEPEQVRDNMRRKQNVFFSLFLFFYRNTASFRWEHCHVMLVWQPTCEQSVDAPLLIVANELPTVV
jgi:hypothetical protein